MIFKRRQQQTLGQKIRNIIWPQMGLKKTAIYYKHRIIRLPHSTRDIAMGLASGCVVSWTPTPPFQILQCYIFCKITRANFLASLLGTTFGNPWTFPILFFISYSVGDAVLDITSLRELMALLIGENTLFQEDGFAMSTFIPTLVGGYIMAVVTFPLFYYSFYYLITAGRASKRVVTNKVRRKNKT